MTAHAKQIIDQALKLDEHDRAEVAHEMLASLGSAEVSSGTVTYYANCMGLGL